MNKIAQYLNQHIAGNVFDKLSIREAYSTDRSIVKAMPRLVAVPETALDIRKLIRFSNQLSLRNFSLPITVRGNGNDTTGAAVGTGLIISMERMNRIREIDVRGRLVRVQTGVTLGELNAALALSGLTIPISGHENDTIGGLIGNCPTDDFAGKYGGIYNYIDRAEIVLSNGDLIQTARLSKHGVLKKQGQSTFESSLYRKISNLLDSNSETISQLTATGGNLDAAGYSTIALVRNKHNFDLLPLFFSAQGTLGVVTEVILHCDLTPAEPQSAIVGFSNLHAATDFLNFAKTLKPLELNLYDGRIFTAAIESGKKIKIPMGKLEKGFVVLVSFNDKHKAKKLLKKCLRILPSAATIIQETPETVSDFINLRGSLVSYLNDDCRGERTPIVDGAFIPARALQDFVKRVRELEDNFSTKLPIFGSFSTSTYSVRPEILLDTVEGRQFALRFINLYSSAIRDSGGTLTGGAPEGSVKALTTKFDPSIEKLYQEIKTTFDPHNILNPAVKLGADPRTTIRHLRTFYNNYIVE